MLVSNLELFAYNAMTNEVDEIDIYEIAWYDAENNYGLEQIYTTKKEAELRKKLLGSKEHYKYHNKDNIR